MAANARVRPLPRAFLYVFLIAAGLLVAAPAWWMLTTSFRTYAQVQRNPVALIPEQLYLGNWAEVFSKFPFLQFLGNTVLVSVVGTIGTVLSCAVVAYGFARFQSRWADILFVFMLATLMIPVQITSIPLYVQFQRFGWVDTFLPLLVPPFFGAAFGIFLLRQFFRSVPGEIVDAAVIDGAGEIRIFWSVYLPLCRGGLLALAVLDFVGRWNDFYNPNLYLQSENNFVLQQGLQTLMAGTSAGSGSNASFGAPYNLLAVGALLSTIPIVIIFFAAQRHFIEGIKLTGSKG